MSILEIAGSVGAAALAFAKISVPAGLAGSVIKLFGKSFSLPRVEAFGQKVEDFFSNVPALIAGRK